MKKNSIVIFFILAILVVAVGCTKKMVIENQKTIHTIKDNQKAIPTVFLHGYKGSSKTMKTMIDQLETDGISSEEMVIYVSGNGELSIEKKPENGFKKNNPTIRLIFEDNTNNQWNQADWLKNALAYLKTTFQVEEINLVGFSMGGLCSFLYLETYSDDPNQPKVNKLATIGTPFNGFIENDGQTIEDILANGPKIVGEELINYENLSDALPEGIQFLLIAGELSEKDQSDGTVPLSSALGAYSLLKEKGEEVSYKVVKGGDGQHSRLRVNEDVSKDILSFLWE